VFEGGQTALGPALCVAVFVASHTAGSSVLLATDGLANKGAGSLEGTEPAFSCHPSYCSCCVDVADETSAGLFYQEVGEQGRLHGVTVSIVSIIGSEARLVKYCLFGLFVV
jgi:hypothetical protein